MYTASAKAAGLEGKWRISLHMPSYLPAMQYANNAALREKLHRAYSTRASEFGPAERDNTPLIRSLLKTAAKKRCCWDLRTTPKSRSFPRWLILRPQLRRS